MTERGRERESERESDGKYEDRKGKKGSRDGTLIIIKIKVISN